MCHTCSPSTILLRRKFLRITAASLTLPFLARTGIALADADPVDLPHPQPHDTCPVCGMFVAKYPEWIATVTYTDGFAEHFDGAKDFFKYLHDMKTHARGRVIGDIVGMGVTDYYSVELISARDAIYVIGSDVLGPMGHELIPHRTMDDAKAFSSDHGGVRVLGFEDVNMDMLLGLDKGRFE